MVDGQPPPVAVSRRSHWCKQCHRLNTFSGSEAQSQQSQLASVQGSTTAQSQAQSALGCALLGLKFGLPPRAHQGLVVDNVGAILLRLANKGPVQSFFEWHSPHVSGHVSSQVRNREMLGAVRLLFCSRPREVLGGPHTTRGRGVPHGPPPPHQSDHDGKERYLGAQGAPARGSRSAMGLQCRCARDRAVLSTSLGPGPPAILSAREDWSTALGTTVCPLR